MYNRYIPAEDQYEAVPGAEQGKNETQAWARQASSAAPPGSHQRSKGGLAGLFGDAVGGIGEEFGRTFKSLLSAFHLENLDAGDILLALIVLFLILEDGDNLDLIITLGLMILFSLGEP